MLRRASWPTAPNTRLDAEDGFRKHHCHTVGSNTSGESAGVDPPVELGDVAADQSGGFLRGDPLFRRASHGSSSVVFGICCMPRADDRVRRMDCSAGDWICELSRIADALEGGFDVNGFIATLLATLVGAGVAAGVSFWLAERDRPRPMWKAETRFPRGAERDGVFALEVVITNIGDGAAYHPRVEVQGEHVTGSRRGSESVLEPGEMLKAWIGVPGSGVEGTNELTGELTDSRVIDWPEVVAAHLEWHQPPRRTRTQRTRIIVTRPTP